MSIDVVELHFIDGPLAGTRKIVHKDIIQRNRTYRHLEPVPNKLEQKVPSNVELNYVQVVCIEWLYIPIKIPASYNGPNRFVMLLEKGLSWK